MISGVFIGSNKHNSITQFLRQHDAPHIFAYLKLDISAQEDEIRAALQARRRWAQAQQSNPKHRTEAVWIIKNISTLRTILIDHIDKYRDSLESSRLASARDALRPFILGAIADGVLSSRAEEVLIERGGALGLPAQEILAEIEHHLQAQSAKRITSWSEQGYMHDEQCAERIAVGRSSVSRSPPAAPPSPSGGGQYLRFDAAGRPHSEAPQLQVLPPSSAVLPVSRGAPTRLSFTVHNTGNSDMRGTIAADRGWLTAHPSTLNPAAKSQVITLIIQPDKMPRNRGQTRVTVSTHRGGSKSFIVQVSKRHSRLPLAVFIGFIIGLLSYITVLVAVPPPPVGSRLLVKVDPPTGEIYINNQLTSTTGLLETTSGFPLGQPFTIRIEASGFATWEEEISVVGGQTRVVKPELVLQDRMNTAPPPRAVQGSLANETVNDAILAQKNDFDLCFIQHVDAEPGLVFQLEVRGVVNQLGEVTKLEFTDQTLRPKALEDCLKRHFRSLNLPILNPRFDYAVFEYIFHYTVPSSQRTPP